MHAVGQAEVVILLQCLPDEKTVPKDIFTHFVQLYQEALTGKSSSTTRPIGNKKQGPNSTVGERWVGALCRQGLAGAAGPSVPASVAAAHCCSAVFVFPGNNTLQTQTLTVAVS